MKIKQIEFRNFNSYGNNFQKIEFDSNNGNFYLVLGKNGSGKSSTSDVIKFGLYGKVDNKKLKDIPNRFNNNTIVKIIIEKSAGTVIRIERGLAPSFLRLFINDVEYDQAGKRNIQEYIEEEVLGIPFYIFNNIISLSINDFKSFISMGANDKRQIIDRMFGLEILAHIKWKVKYKIKTLKEYLDNIDTEINVLHRSIDTSIKELESLNAKILEAGTEKKLKLEEQIKNYNGFIEKANSKIVEIQNKEKEIHQLYNDVRHKLNESKVEHTVCSQKIHLYESGKCPTCESDLTTDLHKSVYHDFLEKDTVIKDSIIAFTEKIDNLSLSKSKLSEMMNEIRNKKTNAESHIRLCNKELDALNNTSSDMGIESLNNIIKDSEVKKKEAIQKKHVEEKRSNFLRIVEDVFGDKGVKLSALKRIIPILNIEIKKVLVDLNLDYRVVFNEEFDVDIQFLGFKVAPEQLSTGERKKIDFSVLIALIRLMKLRYVGLNLIFLDEIFSSIDSDSIYSIVEVLHKTCKELNLNTFVINHSQLPNELFDYIVKIDKNNGFSNLVIESNS